MIEGAYTMLSLLVTLLPVCDQDGDRQGTVPLGDLPRVVRGAHPIGWMTPSITSGS